MKYKQGSDIKLKIALLDSDENAILISSLAGYGIEIFNPLGESIGKWGNLTGYTTDADIFSQLTESSFELNLSQTEYGSMKGKFKAEIQIQYTDADFDDGYRNIFSNWQEIFTIADHTEISSSDIQANMTVTSEFYFQVSVLGSIDNIGGAYDTPADAYADASLAEGALFYLTGDVPGTMKNQVFIKKTT